MESSDAATNGVWQHPYVALEPQSRQIRLLHLQPGQPDDPIECCTSIVSFDEKFTDYEALSYVWGARLYYEWISLDDAFFPVTENLSLALHGLRYKDRERVLWIDAICINQANFSERSEQVSRMHSIFTQASTVVVWMGQAWDTTDIALGFFEMFGLDIMPPVQFPTLKTGVEETTKASMEEDMFATASAKFSALDVRDDNAKEGPSNRSDLGGIEFSVRKAQQKRTRHRPVARLDGDRIATAVKRFMSFPWWTRIWTVQEFVLARSSIFYCGSHTIDGSVLLQCVRHFHNHDRDFKTISRGTHVRTEGEQHELYEQLDGRRKRQCCTLDFDDFPLDDLEETFRPLVALYWVKTIYMTLLRQVGLFRARNASDDRDKIYGVMALTADGHEARIQPDYELPVEKVFEEFALSLIKNTRRLDVFTHIVPNRRRTLNVPSYVPDWTIPLDVSSILTWSTRVNATDQYNACNDTNLAIAVESGAMTVRGVLVDHIERMSLTHLNPRRLETRYGNAVLDEMQELAGLEPALGIKRIDDELHARMQKFWLTICGGLAEVPSQASFGIHNAEYAIPTYRRLHSINDFTHYQEWEHWFRASFGERLRLRSSSKSKFEAITTRIATVSWGRMFMRTQNGRIGFVPRDSQEGDVIAVLSGCRVPMVLRPRDGYYIVVGDAYVHGIMDGEAIEDCNGELRELTLR
jgi:hypothetical protein